MWLRKQKTVLLQRLQVVNIHGEDTATYTTYAQFRATINRLRGEEYDHLPTELRKKSLLRVLYQSRQDVKEGDKITENGIDYIAVGDEEQFVTHSEVMVRYET